MTQHVSAEEIREAGGLEKWAAKAVQSPAPIEQFPDLWFVAVQWQKGEWKFERFRAGGNH